jgi:hypothetical protein
MDVDALRLIIRGKLADGRLPLNSIARVWGGPGNGESCNACDGIVTNDEFVIEGISLAGGPRPLQLHVRCFWLWESERRQQLAPQELTTPPVIASAPGQRASPSVIGGQMNGLGETRSRDEG